MFFLSVSSSKLMEDGGQRKLNPQICSWPAGDTQTWWFSSSVNQQALDPRRANVLVWVWEQERKKKVSVQAVREEEFFLPLRKIRLYAPFGSSIYWIRATMLQKAIFFIQSTNSDINLLQKHPHRTLRVMFYQISGHSMTQLTHKLIISGKTSCQLSSLKHLLKP